MPADQANNEAPSKGEQNLDDRKASILEAVVTEYIGSAQPVGSQHVAAAPGVNVSSATVRSDMAALEQDGYLVQPHTSAGRVPTDKGYRFFVDRLAQPGVLGPSQRVKVRRFFEQVHGEMEELLKRTSNLLSDLTSYAAVVVGPAHDTAPIRSVQVVALSPELALVVVVLADGAVEKCTVELPEPVPDEVARAAGMQLDRFLEGRRLVDLPHLPPAGDLMIDRVVVAAREALADLGASAADDHVFVGGPSRLAEAFDAVETVRSVLSTLEQQMVMVNLLQEVIDRGLSVAIGTEHGFEPLSSCAVVVAPFAVEGRHAGVLGLLGPTRMHYPEALAAAHVVGERLGQRLADESGGGRRGGS